MLRGDEHEYRFYNLDARFSATRFLKWNIPVYGLDKPGQVVLD